TTPRSSSVRTWRPSATACSARSAYGRNARPASVSRTPPRRRTSSGAPTVFSSAFSRAVNAGCVTNSASAARVTEPSRAASTNACSWGCIEEVYANDRQERLDFRFRGCNSRKEMKSMTAELEIAGPDAARSSEILSPEAIDFVARLQRELGPRRHELLAARQERWARLRSGELPDFLEETRAVREDESWRVPPAPRDLRDRRVGI